MTDKKELIRTECINGTVVMSYTGSFQSKRYFVSASGYAMSTPHYDDAAAKFRELSSDITIPM